MEFLTVREARRLALARAGLLKPAWTGFPTSKRTCRTKDAALQVIQRFGYLQLDTVSIAGARSHAIVLLSRLPGFDPGQAESLLQPPVPLFEYWGHEACWIPIELYPVFAFRRKAYQHHPWWGDVIGQHPKIAQDLRQRIKQEGPIRSLDMEGRGSSGWWDLKAAKQVANALWSTGELAIRERRNFQRTYDLAERVIPERWRTERVPQSVALEHLLVYALRGHGWATTTTLVQTWRLTKLQKAIKQALQRLGETGKVKACSLVNADGKLTPGWVRPNDLELAARLARLRPRSENGTLLSPFDPVLWDRARVRQLVQF